MNMDMGKRIADARKVIGLSQQQVADKLGIPQRTFSYYERGNGDLPSSLLVPLAEILSVDVHELLGIDMELRQRRGRKAYLEERLNALRNLPRKEQQFVLKFLDQVIETDEEKRRTGSNRAIK